MARLQERYQKEIIPQLQTKLGRQNVLSLPKLQKIVVNMGVGKALQDKNRMEQSAEQLTSICGQRVQITKARIAVSAFRLRQGTADEAHALVTRAVELFRRRGAACLTEITAAADGFADRDMYVFSWDRALVYHAFAGKPHNVGKTAAQIIGTDTTQLTHDVWAAAARGGGWVDYDFLNPATGQIAPKTSFIVPVAQDLVLGCGIYKTVQRH